MCSCDPIGWNDLPGYDQKMSGMNNFMNLKNQHEDSEAHITLVMPFIKFEKTGIDYICGHIYQDFIITTNYYIVFCHLMIHDFS